MKILRLSRLSNSLIFKSILFLILSMSLIVGIGTHFFAQQQMEITLDLNFNTNKTQLQQLATSANNEMEQFGSRLTLLAKTSEIQSLNPITSAGYLKNYNILSLFISGESVSLYDRKGNLICDNAIVEQKTTYPIDLNKINPHRPYISPWYREDDNPPKRAFGTVVTDRATGNGNLVASFSFRRLWKYFSEYKIGQNGTLIAINAKGEILYHTDLKKWLSDSHKIFELGFKDFDIRNYETNKPTFITLNDDETYLINYIYNPTYDLGLISLQPKSELDVLAASATFISRSFLIFAIIAILFVAFWLVKKLGQPLIRLIHHISQITSGNLDIDEIRFDNREDEIGLISRAFNQMHRTIKRQFHELNAHREILEQEVQQRTKELEDANKKLDIISRTDELTQLPNRRDMNRTIENEIGRSSRTNRAFSFIFFDIDHFKNINDTYGHAAGDRILKAVANTVRALLRKYDVLARYGGEEFLTLLPETDLNGAASVAERFREHVEEMTIKYSSYEIKVTITLGVAQFDPRLGADRSIQLADKALYEGKESGRNKVVIWPPERTTEADYKQAAIENAEIQRQKAEDAESFIIIRKDPLT